MGNLSSKRLPWSYYSLSNCLDDMPSSTSENSADDVAEYAAAFLQSKQWDAEVGSFLDAHCILFVGDATDDQIEHTRLHGEYADLVHRVLQQRLSEMGISKHDAASACGPSSPFLATRRLKKATIEQLAAREDFSVFKGMMARRNKEFERELRQNLEKRKETSETIQPHRESRSESSEECLSSISTGDENDVPPTPSFSINAEDVDQYEYVEDEQLRLLFAATNKILASPEAPKGKAGKEEDVDKDVRLKEPRPSDESDCSSKPRNRDDHLCHQRDILVAKKKAERQNQLEAGSRTSDASRPLKLPSLSPGLSPSIR